MLGEQRRVVVHDDCELEVEPFRIGKPQPRSITRDLDTPGGEPVGPERERLVRLDTPGDQVHHSRTWPARRRTRVLEERDVRAGIAALVSVEEVIDGRV